MDSELKPDTIYKMYLVEESDNDREAVFEARISHLTVNSNPVYEETFSDHSAFSVRRFMVDSGITIEAQVIDGFTVRNFKEEFYAGE